MAVNPVQNYLNDLVRYYQLAPVAQQQGDHHQPILGGVVSGFNVMPGLAFGGGGNRGPNILVSGDASVLDRMREHNREDREEDRATSAAWIGGILTILGAAGLACAMSGWNDIGERLDAAREFKERELPLIDNAHEQRQLGRIVDKDIRILENKHSRARNIMILTGIALASAVTAFAAGMFAIQWLITTAIVVGVATLAIGTFAAVYYCLQKSETPEGIMEYLQTHPVPEAAR